MAKLVFGMMQSLDGYIAGVTGGPQMSVPGERLGRHFSAHVRGLAGMVYGRRMYEVMRYWDDDQPEFDEADHDFARLFRGKPKWVASRTLEKVGPNATLIRGDVGTFVGKLKEEISGEIDIAGPELAGSLTASGLIDEYRLYFRPFVLGGGKPYFAGPVPPLRLVGSEVVGEDAVKLTYAIVHGAAAVSGVDVDAFTREAAQRRL